MFYLSMDSSFFFLKKTKNFCVQPDDYVCVEQVSAEIYRVHSAPEQEPVVLFRCGAVRQLDSLLAAPQQHVEEVLSQEEVIR